MRKWRLHYFERFFCVVLHIGSRQSGFVQKNHFCLFVCWSFMPPSLSFSQISIHCKKVTTSLFWTIFLCCTAHWIKPERFCSKNKVLFLPLFVCLFVCLFGWLVIPHASLLVIQSNYHSVCESEDFSILNDFFV